MKDLPNLNQARRSLAAFALAIGLRTTLAQASETTYSRDVAPIVQRHCAPCHRPGGAGPFSLLSFRELRQHGRLAVQVTQRRLMPPYLAAPTSVPFLHNRRLNGNQIATFDSWFKGGMKPGAPAKAATVTRASDDWPLGRPDLVVRMPKPYTLAAEPTESYRCFVVPLSFAEDKWLRAAVYRPSNPRAVRRARVLIDTTGTARKLESQSGAVGYVDVMGGLSRQPEGSLAEWSPDAAAAFLPKGVARPLRKGADLVLLLRFAPTGKPEPEQSEIGLYFASGPLDQNPVSLPLGARAFVLQPGKKANLTDSYTLPVAARLLALVPAGHAAATTLTVTATPPGGAVVEILNIPNWDLEWNEPYILVTPLAFAARTKLSIEWTFDNSDANPRGLGGRRHFVQAGVNFLDELGSVWLQMVAVVPAEADSLRAGAADRKDHQPKIVESGTYVR